LGHEHVAAVLARSRLEGSDLFLLVVIAHYADQHGEWHIDRSTLEREVRLSRRPVQRILAALMAAGELAVIPGDGRGHPSIYRLLILPKGGADAPLSEPKGGADAPLSAPKGGAHAPLSAPKGGADAPLYTPKGGAHAPLSAPLDPPFPPDPQIPLYPPEKQKQETSGLRPLPGPQSAVLRVKLLLEEAAVPLPSPAQIGLWSKTLGGIEPLLELLRRLIQAGLANKREPHGYIHRVVIERAAHPEPSSPLPLRGGGARGGGASKTRNPVLLAGSDETRRQLALQIIAKQGGKK